MICNSEIIKVRCSLINCIFVINSLKNDNLRTILKEFLEPLLRNTLKELRILDRMLEK